MIYVYIYLEVHFDAYLFHVIIGAKPINKHYNQMRILPNYWSQKKISKQNATMLSLLPV